MSDMHALGRAKNLPLSLLYMWLIRMRNANTGKTNPGKYYISV
jgi:hypothetical protein